MATEPASELPLSQEDFPSQDILVAEDTPTINNSWRRKGRAIVLCGAFALPLFCASPWFEIPLQYRLRHQSAVGVAFQVAKMLPALMTLNGFVLWFAWRSGWQPTRRRRIAMYALSAAALLLLPLACSWLQLVSSMIGTEGWRNALLVSFQLFGPSQAALFIISEIVFILLALAGLRVVAMIWNVALVEPCRTIERRRAKFSILGILATTAGIAVLAAALQMLFRQLPFADYPQLRGAIASGAIVRASTVVLGVITATLVARIGWPTLDVMIPRIGVVAAMVIALYYTARKLQIRLPLETSRSADFTLLEVVSYPIALVLAMVLVVAILRSLGLILSWGSD